jgi:hypothetical protein
MLTALIAISLIGCGQQEQQDVGQTQEGDLVLGQSEVMNEIDRAVAPGSRLLLLTGFNGTVRLDGTDRDVAQLTFIERGRGQDEAAARAVLDGIQLTERGNASRYEYVMRSDRPERSEVDVRGTVPRNTELRVDYESGAVALSGVEGPIEVAHESGNVHIAGAGSSVRVSIQNGSIQAGFQQMPASAEVELTTSNGDIILAVPENASAQVVAETQAGSINTQDVRFESRRLEPQGAGARFEAQLGTGNATVNLRTENGTITLRRRRSMAPLPADSMEVEPTDTTQAAPTDPITRSDTAADPFDTSTADPSVEEAPSDTTTAAPDTSNPFVPDTADAEQP